MARSLQRALVVAIAAMAAVGGLALTGINVSVATAPLLPFAGETADRAVGVAASAPQPARTPAPLQAEALSAASELAFLDEPPRRYTSDEVRLIALVAGWPERLLDEVVEVAWCESRNDPLAANVQVLGLMQVHPLWFRHGGHDLAAWSDPVVNLRAALTAYEYDVARGYETWTQWQCRPGGRYIPAAEFSPPLPDVTPEPVVAAASGETATPEPDPSPTPTLAPWEQVPLWPPPVTPEPSPTPVPTASAGAPGGPGVLILPSPAP